MAVFLSPEDEYRRLKGYAPDHPVPISMDSPTLPRGQARNLEMQRYAALDAPASGSRQRAGIDQPAYSQDGVRNPALSGWPSNDVGRFNSDVQTRFDAGASADELRQLAAAQGRDLQGLDTAVRYRDRGGRGVRFVSPSAPATEAPPEMSMIDAARKGIGVVQSGLDVATLGAAATGVGAPVSTALTLVNDGLEGGLLALNGYDAYFNGNSDPFKAQLAALPIRFLPAGRLLQKGMVEARGATGILRDSVGRFRPSYLKHDAVREASQQAAEAVGGGVAEGVFSSDNKQR